MEHPMKCVELYDGPGTLFESEGQLCTCFSNSWSQRWSCEVSEGSFVFADGSIDAIRRVRDSALRQNARLTVRVLACADD